MLYNFLLAVLGVLAFDHPIHVSVTDIEYDKERKALEISTHIFIDDVEKHIRQLRNEPYLDIINPKNNELSSDELIEGYLKKRLAIKVNGKALDINYLGYEAEAGAMYVYLEIEKVRKLESITVKNEVLLGLFDDQTNLVHVKVGEELKSLKITERNKEGLLEF